MKISAGHKAIWLVIACNSIIATANTQPANDNPCGAISIPVVQSADPCTPTMYQTVNPTYTALALPDAGNCPGPVAVPNYPDYWYKFTATSSSIALNFIAEQGTTTGGGVFGAGANYFVVYKASNCNGPFTLAQTCGRSDILYSRQFNNLEVNGTYYIRVVSALSDVATSNIGICASSNMPPSTSKVGINVNQPKANLDVAGNVLFRHDVNFQGRMTYYGAGEFSQSGLPDSVYGLPAVIRFSDMAGKKIILGNGWFNDNTYPGGTLGQAAIGVGGGTIQIQYPSVNGGGISFGYGNGVSSFTQTAALFGTGTLNLGGNLNVANNAVITGSTTAQASLGVGGGPSGKLAVTTTGTQLGGNVMSNAFKINGGNLGTSPGNELSIASLGFMAGGNNTSMGIRGFRAQAGNDWTGTAILLEYDVDNTMRPTGAFLCMYPNGNIGINTAYPTAPLSFPAVLGKKIVFYPGGVGAAQIGVYSNELRISSDYSAAKISFGYDDYNNGFTELAKVEKNGSYAMSIFGSLWVNGVTYASDGRFKKNVEPLEDALDKILLLQGVSYQMKVGEFPDQSFDGSVQVGLIAQEVEKIVPEVVSTAANGYKAIDYAKLVPLLIESIKTQEERIRELEKKIEQLQKTKTHK